MFMNFMEKIWKNAKEESKKIVLAEGEEERTIQASEIIMKNSLATVILIGNEERIRTKAITLNVTLGDIEIIDPETSEKIDEYAQIFYELRKNKGMTLEKAEKIVRDPIY